MTITKEAEEEEEWQNENNNNNNQKESIAGVHHQKNNKHKQRGEGAAGQSYSVINEKAIPGDVQHQFLYNYSNHWLLWSIFTSLAPCPSSGLTY